MDDLEFLGIFPPQQTPSETEAAPESLSVSEPVMPDAPVEQQTFDLPEELPTVEGPAETEEAPVAEEAEGLEEPFLPETPPIYDEAAEPAPQYAPFTETVRPQSYAEPFVPPQPAPAPRKKSRRSHSWLWLLLGLAVGFGLGFLTARLLPRETKAPDSGQMNVRPERPQGDLTDRLQIADDAAIATAPSKVYDQNVASVVGIASETTTNVWGQISSVASVGTGFIISEDGYILTNYHVVEGASSVTVMLYDGREIPAALIGYDSETCDIALLKIEAEGLQPVTFGDSDGLLVGQQVCAIGNPLGELTYSLTVGYVSAKDRAINTDGTPINMLQTDCVINAGNSGGPLFDMNGNVIGITTAKYSGTTTSGASVEGIGFAIPINDVLVLLDDLQTYGYVATRAYLGVNVRVNPPAGDYPAGAFISEVVNGHCAEAAGIRSGDIIVAIDDYVVSSYNDLVATLRHFSAGDQVQVRIWRDGEYLTLPLTFDSRPHDEQTAPEETDTAVNPFPGWSFPFP